MYVKMFYTRKRAETCRQWLPARAHIVRTTTSGSFELVHGTAVTAETLVTTVL
jgi:hypothetical protein